METPRTLQAAIVHFSDPQRAFEAAVEYRWVGGQVTCPRCGQEKHSFVKTRRIWFCYPCQKQFTVKVGTVMEDSPLGLDKWMVAIWMLANCKNGISSYELSKAIGVRQNSAWFLLHRIREAMGTKPTKKMGGSDSGPVEADEVFIGPKPKFMHANRRAKLPRRGEKNVPIMGILDRESRQVRAKVVPNVKRETLQEEILNHVEKWSKLYTDGWQGYDGLDEYVHKTVSHIQEYVRGEVHTQGIENFWSLLRRTLRGTYVAVEPFHLDAYVTEQVFRFNNRATKDNPINDADRFAFLMSQVAGKRLTYAKLTGKDDDALHSSEAGTRQEVPF
ncbi:MAG TPA: IS1595 family transposase [Acidobacteriaceae bacterium]|jgi:transposase-like protein